ncbi:MAG TPA: hypothetical protein VGE09_06615 [Pseudoxanthomonas sp.]
MNVDARERNHFTKDEMDELLGMLLAANEQGQLVGLVFMVKNGAAAAVDYRGTHELVELATREVRTRIADEIEHTHPKIAATLRAELAVQVH